MPYVCLANDGIPDGTVQVLDLHPNTSQAVPAGSPATQTGYVNRVQNDAVSLESGGTLAVKEAMGLRAYLMDRVEPGGREQAAGTITVVGATAGDTVTIGGVVFTCVAGAATAADQEFTDLATAGTATAVAASLRTAVLDAASVAAMKLVTANTGGTFTPRYVHALANTGAQLNLTARYGSASELYGYLGSSLALATSVSARFTLSGARLQRTHETWTAAYLAAAADALIARVDAGSALALTDINTSLNSTSGADLSGTNTGSRSTGTVADLLSVLAGRGYKITRAPAGSLTPSAYFNATNPTYQWTPTQFGSFTQAVVVQGYTMQQGEIKPLTIGGDTVQREWRPIRTFVDTDSFKISAALGSLATFSKVTGAPAVTLWPDSDRTPHFPWSMQPDVLGPVSAEANARVLTIYADDGTIYA